MLNIKNKNKFNAYEKTLKLSAWDLEIRLAGHLMSVKRKKISSSATPAGSPIV